MNNLTGIALIALTLSAPYIADWKAEADFNADQAAKEGHTAAQRASMDALHAKALKDAEERNYKLYDISDDQRRAAAIAFVFGINEDNFESYKMWGE